MHHAWFARSKQMLYNLCHYLHIYVFVPRMLYLLWKEPPSWITVFCYNWYIYQIFPLLHFTSPLRKQAAYRGKQRLLVLSEGLGIADKGPCPRVLLSLAADLNWEPYSWESMILSTVPWQLPVQRGLGQNFGSGIFGTTECVSEIHDDINRTLGYQVKICHFVHLFILFFRAVSGFKSAKYLCRMHNKIFKSSYCVINCIQV